MPGHGPRRPVYSGPVDPADQVDPADTADFPPRADPEDQDNTSPDAPASNGALGDGERLAERPDERLAERPDERIAERLDENVTQLGLPADDGASPGPTLSAPTTDPGTEWRAPLAISYRDPDTLPPTDADDDSRRDPDLPYWLAFNRVKGIGPARFALLLARFRTARAAWEAGPTEWRAAGLDERTAASLARQRARITPEGEVERLDRLRVAALTLAHPAYPKLLREIALPPPVLYVRGRLLPDDEWAVAVVGTRRVSVYGKQVTERLAGELAAQRITIISGLARGVDTAAHQAALGVGGRTIAVLGCGPDLVYPPENKRLAARIVEAGAIVTEFAPGTQPEAGNFPARNRLISGLSLAVLVTEAPASSGALITTRFAAEQGRDVLAVPGNITARGSYGTNKLIQDGAKLVLETEDVLAELNLHLVPVQQRLELRDTLPENAAEARLIELLGAASEPLHVDELCRASGLPVADVSATLVMLELKGLVRQHAPMTYARSH
ncbi:MAG TPA: DNA-processing protein DprA [Ktedonobacterales bacterium]